MPFAASAVFAVAAVAALLLTASTFAPNLPAIAAETPLLLLFVPAELLEATDAPLEGAESRCRCCWRE